MPESASARLAVLIDADNTSASHAGALLDELARYGTATVKRAYGDWTTPRLGGWKEALNRLAIQPVQQFAYTTGKNATDSALIIDAMDLLYSGNLDAFALVSSDSDFTRLATRLRESGRTVYGLGRRRTPESLVKACDKFIYLEVLGHDGAGGQADLDDADDTDRADDPPLPDLRRLLVTALDALDDDQGWTSLSVLGSYLVKTDASFDPRNYGFGKLSTLAKAQDYLDVTLDQDVARVRLRDVDPPPKKAAAKKQPATEQATQQTAKKTTSRRRRSGS